MTFEDKNCIITYNLWDNGGNVGFTFFNKTENDLTLDLTKTFFVINGIAYEYFQNRTYSSTSNSGSIHTAYPYYNWFSNTMTISEAKSNSYSTSFNEKPELTIPSNTSINVSEYHLMNSCYEDCDLQKYPSYSKSKILKFDKTNSPIVFYNIITYKNGLVSEKVYNKFYVSTISNMPNSEMFIKTREVSCENKLDEPVFIPKDKAPNKFYIEYYRTLK